MLSLNYYNLFYIILFEWSDPEKMKSLQSNCKTGKSGDLPLVESPVKIRGSHVGTELRF